MPPKRKAQKKSTGKAKSSEARPQALPGLVRRGKTAISWYMLTGINIDPDLPAEAEDADAH